MKLFMCINDFSSSSLAYSLVNQAPDLLLGYLSYIQDPH